MLLALRNYLDKLFCKHEWEDVDEVTSKYYEYSWDKEHDLPIRTERTFIQYCPNCKTRRTQKIKVSG